MSTLEITCPAKLNLFLHVIGRRADGYHLLQSVFQLIDLADTLQLELLPGEEMQRTHEIEGVPAQQDLCMRAARLLQDTLAARGQPRQGLRYTLQKRIPMGGGLGGGSSDAAGMLLGANHLWQGGLTREELMALGLQLGADVPFFIFGQNAFVEGIGEIMQPVQTRDCAVVVIAPGVHVPTPEIFSSKHLTRDTKPVRIKYLSSSELSEKREFGKNDLQGVANYLYPQINDAIIFLSQFGDAKMTGSGSCVYCRVADKSEADKIVQLVPDKWKAFSAVTLKQHPAGKLSETKQNF